MLLAVSRVASGETAPLLFTALGNRSVNFWVDWKRWWPVSESLPAQVVQGLTEPISALPLQIFNYAISPYPEWHQQAWAAALVLLLLVLGMNLTLRKIAGK